jgi:hypothetical protein
VSDQPAERAEMGDWEAAEDGEQEESSSLALFEGDEGRLTVQERTAVVTLLKNRFITASSHPKVWTVLRCNPRTIRSSLNDLFLELVVDRNAEVAYKRQVAPEAADRFPTLLHDRAWQREETIVLVFARARYRSEKSAGAERVFVEREDLLDYVADHRSDRATDVAGDLQRAQRAIDSIVRAGVLVGAVGGPRLEISPAIEVMLPMSRLRELLEWLRTQSVVHRGDEARDQASANGPDTPTPDGLIEDLPSGIHTGFEALDEPARDYAYPLSGLTPAGLDNDDDDDEQVEQ